MKVACISDMGRSREINEDDCTYYKYDNGWNLLIVADGMGGHNAGEVASKMAIKSITDYIKGDIKDNITNDGIINLIKHSVKKANDDIYSESINNTLYSGMGTTVSMAMISKHVMLVGHVGDSRVYILKDRELKRITNDHSLVAELLKSGTITEDEALHHPQKNIITRALGTENSVDVDIENIVVEQRDVVLLCTDGLTNMVTDKEIQEMLLSRSDINIAAQELVGLANNRGGYDNITVVIGEIAYQDKEVKQW